MSDETVKGPARIDGAAKVTGAARYAADFAADRLAHAAIVQSGVAAGRVVAIETGEAEAAPGVLAVLTHRNAPRLPYRRQHPTPPVDPEIGAPLPMLQDPLIRHNGQPIAVVVAESREEAEHAASLVRASCEMPPKTPVSLDDELAHAFPLTEGNRGGGTPAAYRRGDPAGAMAGAAVTIGATYVLPRENHNPIEPHATVAEWSGDRLTLHDKTQWVGNVRDHIAHVFGIEAEKVRVVSPFVGGAFGSALRTWPHVTLAAMAARHVGRPVKLALTRRQMFSLVGCRPRTIQDVALGADAEGRLVAIRHEAVAETSAYEEYSEPLLNATHLLYDCANLDTLYRLVRLDIHTPTPMRGPGHVSGIHALECAMDELAAELGLDPLDLRLRNHAPRNPKTGEDWTSASLPDCLRLATERFGWHRRDPAPGAMREDGALVGYGLAAAVYPARRGPATASITLDAEGGVTLRTASSDMGPGTYTATAQVAAMTLGVPVERVRVEIGDTDLPEAPVHGGSMTMASVGPAVRAACLEARGRLLAMARDDGNSPLASAAEDDVTFDDGRVARKDDPSAGESHAEILARHGEGRLECLGSAGPGEEYGRASMHSFGAVCAEVLVDPDLGTVRVRRLVGAYDVGRIVNERLARSQCIGGMTGGIGMALTEATRIDHRTGRVTSAGFSDYLVPVAADVGDLDVHFLGGDDPNIGPLGARGVAEIAICGVAPAIANAVFHATGRRVREMPITPEKLL